MIKPAWKIWIYLSEPLLAFLLAVFASLLFGADRIGKGIADSYIILLGLIGGGVTISLGLYGFFFQKTVSFLGRVLRKAGYYRIFNYGFLAPICIYIISGLFTYFSGQLSLETALHKVTFFFLIYSILSFITSIQNISGFARVCMDLEAEIERVDEEIRKRSGEEK